MLPMSKLFQKFVNLDYRIHIFLSLTIRLLLVIYGIHHDQISDVKFTDIDYKVFTDASRHILNGGSPYMRHTYRYSPLIAIVLIPNILIHPSFGKIIFSLADIFVGLLIRVVVKSSVECSQEKNQKNEPIKKLTQFKKRERKRNKTCHQKPEKVRTQGDIWADRSMLLWLYNPMTVAISTRGNSDSIACFLVLLTLYFLECKKLYFITGLIHGLSIHFRLYPIIYSFTYFLSLSRYSLNCLNEKSLMQSSKLIKNGPNNKKIKYTKTDSIVPLESKEPKSIFKSQYLLYLIPNTDQLKLIFGTALSLFSLTAFFYYLYGYQFLYESLIYHFVRTDTRHNFSLYFYLLYLTAWIKNLGHWQSVLIILPQLVLLLVFSVKFGLNKYSLNFAVLLQTIVMVIYNKVLTSQYFVWIMGIFPLCIWQIRMSKNTGIVLGTIWFSAQMAWLLPAYLLEFQGENTFLYIWIQGVSLFCAHVAILGRLIKNFVVPKVEQELIKKSA